jgi:N-glycosylase/DNA lyase
MSEATTTRESTVEVADLPGGFDLQSTVESGQTYLWDREDDRMYDRTGVHGGSAWYYTAVEGSTLQTTGARAVCDGVEVVRVRLADDRLEWVSTTDATPILRELLRLDDDLAEIRRRSPDDDLVAAGYDAFEGMRLVRDPSFAGLVSFICSAQMRVSRIHSMVTALSREYGASVEWPGPDGELRQYQAFPTPERLAAATEAELRYLGLGYRAPYVERTAEMVADGPDHPANALELDYEPAREYLTRFVGVGQKVADCVLLFSLGFLEAVPLDTWIRTAIEDHYPDCARGNYAETSRAIRERFGGEVAGYVQTYVFNLLRTENGR